MLFLIITAISAIASIASSAINANSQRDIAQSQAEIEELKLKEAEIELDIEEQKTLQVAIKAKSDKLVLMQTAQDKSAQRNTQLMLGAMALAAYVSFLALRPTAFLPGASPQKSSGVGTVATLLLSGLSLVVWASVAQTKQNQPKQSPPKTPIENV